MTFRSRMAAASNASEPGSGQSGGFGASWDQDAGMPDAVAEIWRTIVGEFASSSRSLAVGLFGQDGSVLYVNPGMQDLLWPADQAVQGLDRLMSPSFADLIVVAQDTESDSSGETDSVPRLAHTGWVQVGSVTEFSRSIFAQVWHHGEQILLIGEHDVAQLLMVEQEVMLLNGRLSDLQREVTLKNHKLTQTLAELRETQAMLIHSEKMNAMGHLVAGVAHEINNPVAFVASNLQGMRAAVADLAGALAQMQQMALASDFAGRAHAVQAIRDEFEVEFAFEDLDEALSASLAGLDRVKKIVENLRTFSRHDEADYKVTDVRECLTSTLAILEPEMRNKVTVQMDLPDLPPIPCYAAQLSQVFMNLLLNATQAMDGSGTITVRGEEDAKEIRLSFADTGPGIPGDVLTKIFDAFFTTKPVGSGTGLGLFLCHKIIAEDHKGRISATSEPGKGAVFTVALPKGGKA